MSTALDTWAEQISSEILRTVRVELARADISPHKAADLTGIWVEFLRTGFHGAPPLLVTELAALADVLGTTVSTLLANMDLPRMPCPIEGHCVRLD
jgi:hypothetical protein